ncbi:glycosyltransferase family 4 protein [Bacteroides sp.]|uniref:glycosyltransferase family 4 protein n=1 Tax=Bacteroides sp. TaxID=29523 RepID=UPI0025C1330C|nr:glycosyltransferase family 4 protein [Bacteroides sp.]
MKILFISENYFPNVSGVPVVVKYLAEGLSQRGNDVVIATKMFKDEPLEDNVNGVKVYRFPIYLDGFHRYCGNRDEFINFVKFYKADVLIVECSQCITTDLLLPHLKDIPGKKIFHSHGFSGLELKPFQVKGDLLHTIGNTWNWLTSKWYFGHILKNAMKYFDASMCLSKVDSSREYLKEHIKNSHILDNAADNMFFVEGVEVGALLKYTKLENVHYMMCCANYTVVKNQKDMILQYYKSQASHNTSLVCIGSFPTDYYKECCMLVAQLEEGYGHRDVHLLHGVNRKDIPSIMKGASLYLVTSHYEQYSISIIEAMSQGLPFISMDTGNACVLPGGITIKHVDDMSVQIDRLMSRPEERLKYASAGIEYARRNCRINAVIDKIETIIRSIL